MMSRQCPIPLPGHFGGTLLTILIPQLPLPCMRIQQDRLQLVDTSPRDIVHRFYHNRHNKPITWVSNSSNHQIKIPVYISKIQWLRDRHTSWHHRQRANHQRVLAPNHQVSFFFLFFFNSFEKLIN